MAKNDTAQLAPQASQTNDQTAPKLKRTLPTAALRISRRNGKGEHAGSFNAALVYDDRAAATDVPVLSKRAGKLFTAGIVITARGMELQLQGSRIVVEPAALGYFRKSTTQAVSEVLEACAAYIGSGQKNTVTVDVMPAIEVDDTPQ